MTRPAIRTSLQTRPYIILPLFKNLLDRAANVDYHLTTSYVIPTFPYEKGRCLFEKFTALPIIKNLSKERSIYSDIPILLVNPF